VSRSVSVTILVVADDDLLLHLKPNKVHSCIVLMIGLMIGLDWIDDWIDDWIGLD